MRRTEPVPVGLTLFFLALPVAYMASRLLVYLNSGHWHWDPLL